LKLPHLAKILFVSAALYGCDGNNSSNNSGTGLLPGITDATFSGTVSTTQALAENTVYLKTPQGAVQSLELDETGQFSLSDGTLSDRYLMRVDLGNNNYLYSIAHLTLETGNRQNIHSYSDLTARSWFADQGQDIDFIFSNDASIENFPEADEYLSIDSNIQSIVSDVLQVYGLTEVNLSSASYEATDIGIDRFLNENQVVIRGLRATILVNDPQTNMQSVAVNQVALANFGATDVIPPQQPLGLRANGTGDNEVVLAWAASTDNIAIASYEIYRDDELIDHTPFPLYRDSDLAADTDYSYSIVARDEAGNSSEASVTAIGRVLDTADIEAPATPSLATLQGNTQEIQIFWLHSDLADVARFEVTRTSDEDGILIREVTSSQITDITVASGTEYCYDIVAIDASGNRSESNQTSCITTSGVVIEDIENNTIPATITMAQASISGTEGTTISLFVERSGDPVGEISVDYRFMAGTATSDIDYIGTDGTLVWSDGDEIARRIFIDLLNDNNAEERETLSVVLSNSSANAVVGQASTLVTIVDN